jgi:hypothetical protein
MLKDIIVILVQLGQSCRSKISFLFGVPCSRCLHKHFSYSYTLILVVAVKYWHSESSVSQTCWRSGHWHVERETDDCSSKHCKGRSRKGEVLATAGEFGFLRNKTGKKGIGRSVSIWTRNENAFDCGVWLFKKRKKWCNGVLNCVYITFTAIFFFLMGQANFNWYSLYFRYK